MAQDQAKDLRRLAPWTNGSRLHRADAAAVKNIGSCSLPAGSLRTCFAIRRRLSSAINSLWESGLRVFERESRAHSAAQCTTPSNLLR